MAIVLGASLTVGYMVGATPSAQAVSPAAPLTPRTPKVPIPGSSSQLKGVACTSSSNCWSVGGYSSGGSELNEALRWNGTKWSRVATPNPGGSTNNASNELVGVRCNAPSDCWAVGDFALGGVQRNEALRWNGTKWSVVTTPNGAGTNPGAFNGLFDVTCTAKNNCWAVGEDGFFGAGYETILNQVLRWNGTKWSVYTVTNPGTSGPSDANVLQAVRCTSAANCWAVGTYGFIGSPLSLLNQALHWNGTTWSQIATPNPDGTGGNSTNTLDSVSCTSPADCWATGAYGAEATTVTQLNQALHWDGAQWSLMDTPDPDGTGEGAQNQLLGVTCVSTSDCWGVGTYGSISGGVGVILNEALRWNGTAWSLVSTPDPGGTSDLDANNLFAVRCTSATNCWAVGDAHAKGAEYHNEALRWNGTKWLAG
jgi:hypothetical protein